jgi:hypothetical protein
MLSYFTGLQHIRPDVNSINLNRAKVVIPLYEKEETDQRNEELREISTQFKRALISDTIAQ